jgi:hypothetical protein
MKSKVRITFVSTLFTFCPPGPPERANENVISLSGMVIVLLAFMVKVYPGRAVREIEETLIDWLPKVSRIDGRTMIDRDSP